MVTKKNFVDAFAEENEMTKKDSALLYDSVFGLLSKLLMKGETVAIPGVGQWKIVERDERVCRNPQDGSEIVVPKHFIPKFKAAKCVRDAVKEL